MTNRRDFLKDLAGTAGIVFVGCSGMKAALPAVQAGGTTRRREVVVAGRRVKTVDVHCHCVIREAWEAIKDYDVGRALRGQLDGPVGASLSLGGVGERLAWMDLQGLDVQAVSINPFWDQAERDVAATIIRVQNEKIAELCAAHPDRFVGMATVSLQYPFLAAEQLEHGVRRLGLRGCLIGGSVNGVSLADRRFNPFWAKAEELGCLIFIHPQASGVASEIEDWLAGNGGLSNVIGNPLETTVALSHLIFEGTLDRYPGLKICAAHGGGYLPSYIGRSDRCVSKEPFPCRSARPLAKRPSEYLKQLYFDSMVFTAQGLRHLAAESGPGQIVLGTDYPFGWTSEAVDHILSTPGLSDADKRAMLGETAARLLRIAS
jgi:aminocarboxymuconate-semialdehyde decarboxylase